MQYQSTSPTCIFVHSVGHVSNIEYERLYRAADSSQGEKATSHTIEGGENKGTVLRETVLVCERCAICVFISSLYWYYFVYVAILTFLELRMLLQYVPIHFHI